MQTNSVKGASLAILGAGVAISLVSAVQPHFNAGYRIDALLLFAGLAPYAMYIILSGSQTDAGANGTGLGVLVVHVALVITGGNAELYGPPVVAAVLFLLILAGLLGGGDDAPHDDDHGHHDDGASGH